MLTTSVTKMSVFLLFFFAILVQNSHSLSSAAEIIGEGEEDVKRFDFPDGFLFGTTTSAYQVGIFWINGVSDFACIDVLYDVG